MTELLSWRTDWNTGIDWVDADHREMVRRLNRLAEACRCGPDEPPGAARTPCKELVLERLDDLIEHNRRHFQSEEQFLREITYPRYEEHRREHVMQMAEFLDLRRALDRDLAQSLSRETLQEFKRWFFNHVIAEDRLYADYFQSRAGRQDPHDR